jgi:AcrR family transcriptional regulator
MLSPATELFYTNGYQATGINEIFKKSGVAKATYYDQFPSKEELCKAYVQHMDENGLSIVTGWVDRETTPRGRLMALLKGSKEWLKETHYKGCSFLNLVPEIVDPESSIRKMSQAYYGELNKLLKRFSKKLIESDIDRYGHLTADRLAYDYLNVFTGTITLSALYHDCWPMEKAIQTMNRILK